MRLINLVEQQDAEWFLLDCVRKLSTRTVSHISRRRTDEPLIGMRLSVFTHIKAYHKFLISENDLGQRLGQLRLTGTGRPRQKENSLRTTLRPSL